MWFESRWPKVLAAHNARLEALERAPALTLPQVEIGAHERLQGRVGAIERLLDALKGQATEIVAIDSTLQRLLADQEDMKLAISEGIERVDRAERRIRGTVARARQKLADSGVVDEGLEAEQHYLAEGDGDGAAPVPDLPDEEDDFVDEPSSIPGVPLSVVQRLRGF